MIYRSWAYRNPESILIDEENRTCKGCKHLRTAFGGEAKYCDYGRKLKRCKYYQEGKPDDEE